MAAGVRVDRSRSRRSTLRRIPLHERRPVRTSQPPSIPGKTSGRRRPGWPAPTSRRGWLAPRGLFPPLPLPRPRAGDPARRRNRPDRPGPPPPGPAADAADAAFRRPTLSDRVSHFRPGRGGGRLGARRPHRLRERLRRGVHAAVAPPPGVRQPRAPEHAVGLLPGAGPVRAAAGPRRLHRARPVSEHGLQQRRRHRQRRRGARDHALARPLAHPGRGRVLRGHRLADPGDQPASRDQRPPRPRR